MNQSNEIIGLSATVFVLIAFLMRGERKIRIFDLIGAILFVAYGMKIGSMSTVLLNTVLVGIQIFKICTLKGD